MCALRLSTFQNLQVTSSDCRRWVDNRLFDDYMKGFYVRIKLNENTWGIGRVEDVRFGVPYAHSGRQLTKYLVVYHPPGPVKPIPFTEISDQPFQKDELEHWDASTAILHLSASHEINESEAKCRREELSKADVPFAVQLRNRAKIHDPTKRSTLDQPRSAGAKGILNSIALFEQKAQGKQQTGSDLKQETKLQPVTSESSLKQSTSTQDSKSVSNSKKSTSITHSPSRSPTIKPFVSQEPRRQVTRIRSNTEFTHVPPDLSSLVDESKSSPRTKKYKSKPLRSPSSRVKSKSNRSSSSDAVQRGNSKTDLDIPETRKLTPETPVHHSVKRKKKRKSITKKVTEALSPSSIRNQTDSGNEDKQDTKLSDIDETITKLDLKSSQEDKSPPRSLVKSSDLIPFSSVDDDTFLDQDESSKGSEEPQILKRHMSSEDARIIQDQILPSPRVNGPPLLSRFILPVCFMPDAKEWEFKKLRALEKQAKNHAKEKEVLAIEEAGVREKFPLDEGNLLSNLEREQFQEREAMNRKIIQDKANLGEQCTQERRALEKTLNKARRAAKSALESQHDKSDKKTTADFEKQINAIKKANRGTDKTGDELLNRLQQAHKAHMLRNHHTKELNELKLYHKHELENIKKLQELSKKHTQLSQKLERDILIRQLSLSQKHLRQKRWLSLDALRARQTALRSLQERRHQLEIKHESEVQELGLKLLDKQQQMELDYSCKALNFASKKDSVQFHKTKKNLEFNHTQIVRKIQKDKSLPKEEARMKLNEMKQKYKIDLEQLAQQLKSTDSPSEFDSISSNTSISRRHEEQLEFFHQERKRRRDVLLVYHQTDKNNLQEEMEQSRKELEQQLRSSIAEFEAEEIKMKEAFIVGSENSLWELTQIHWRETQKLQAKQHEKQQKVLGRIQEEVTAAPYVDEEERTQAAEQVTVEQQQLEQQQEEEKLKLEQERAQEQEQLKFQLEEEKKEVMAVKIVEDELTLRQEYIRKLANDTGLSEELIAKQLDVIGMPSFMF